MADEYPGVVPMLSYENCPAALEWLARAFGFRERARLPERDGRIGHAEMETDHGVVMLASGPAGYQSPATRCKEYQRIREWLMVPWVVDGVLVYVDRVNAHYERAQRAGAKILSPPEDAPYGRLYRAEDLEGHRWMFMERPESNALVAGEGHAGESVGPASGGGACGSSGAGGRFASSIRMSSRVRGQGTALRDLFEVFPSSFCAAPRW